MIYENYSVNGIDNINNYYSKKLKQSSILKKRCFEKFKTSFSLLIKLYYSICVFKKINLNLFNYYFT